MVSKKAGWIAIGGLLIVAVVIALVLSGRETSTDIVTEETSEKEVGQATIIAPHSSVISPPPSSPIGQPVEPTPTLSPYDQAFRQGTIYYEDGEYRKAIASYTEAVSHKTDSASAYNDRGNAHTQLGNYADALIDYNKAIELNPALPEPYYNRGWIENLLGDFEKALADFELARNISPAVAHEATLNRCLIYYALGDYEQAVTECSVAINFDSGGDRAYTNRALAHIALQDYPAAITDYTQGILLNPQNSEAFWGLGWANYKLGNFQAAIDATQQAAQLAPEDPRLQFNLGLYFVASGQPAEAKSTYETALRLTDALETGAASNAVSDAVTDLEELSGETPELQDDITLLIDLINRAD